MRITTAAPRPYPRLPDLERPSLVDRAAQSAVGAAAWVVPTGLGALGATVGEAVAGPWGRLAGGVLGAAGAAAGTYYGLGQIPTEDDTIQRKLQSRLALKAGLLGALGAVGGGLAVGASALGGALLSGRVLDCAESMFAYGPTPPSSVTPDWVQERTLTASDGTKLQAWFTPEPAGAPVCLFFHSNATSLDDNLGRLEQLRDAGLRVLAVEYRGFGKSEGIPSERGLKLDARAAYEEALKEVKPEQILIYGQSIGGGVAANLASEVPSAGLMLESTFTGFSAMAQEMGGWAAMLTRGRFPVADQVRDLQVPVFVAHGDWDTMIPAEHGRTLAQRNPLVSYVEVPGAGHMDVCQDPKFTEGMKAFLARAL